MRRVLGAVVAVVCVALLASCALLPALPGTPEDDDSKQQSDVVMQHIADAVKDHDAAALKKLFSPPARENARDLNSGLKYFLSFFPSGRMTWESEGTASSGYNDFPKQTNAIYAKYKVFADGKKYDLYFADFTINTAVDPGNVGIWALGITPYSSDPFTASGAPKPFYAWSGAFQNGNFTDPGTPGVYVPQN
jgi:hypothetical protein